MGITTVSMPTAGAYALWPTVTLLNATGVEAQVECTIGGSYSSPTGASKAVVHVGARSGYVPLSWSAVVTVSEPTTLSIVCQDRSGKNTELVVTRAEVTGLRLASASGF